MKSKISLGLTREVRKQWNMKATVKTIVIFVLGPDIKEFVQWLKDLEIRRWKETMSTTALLGLARILRRVLQTWWDSDSSEKPSADADVKKCHIKACVDSLGGLYVGLLLWTPSHSREKAGQPARTYNTAALCRKQWTIEQGGEKRSGISVLMARHVVDDDDGDGLAIIQCYVYATWEKQ